MATVDIELHSVVVAALPEHAHLIDPVPRAPSFVVFLEIGKQVDEEGFVGMNVIDGDRAIGEPRGVVAWLGTRGAEPVVQEVASEFRVFEPANLVDLVAGGAGYPSICAGPKGPVGELGERVATVGRAVANVAGDQLPTVVIGSVDLSVRAFEEGDIGLEPIEVAVRPEGLRFKLLPLVEQGCSTST